MDRSMTDISMAEVIKRENLPQAREAYKHRRLQASIKSVNEILSSYDKFPIVVSPTALGPEKVREEVITLIRKAGYVITKTGNHLQIT